MCTSPITGYQIRDPTSDNFEGSLFFSEPKYADYRVLQVPCGQCMECRLKKSREWALRCVHESKLYDDKNMFLTLTYAPDKSTLDQQWSLNHEDFTKFIKRYRKKFGDKIRYYHCGEYGDKYNRPHHHTIIFNHWLPDLRPISYDVTGVLYTSDILAGLWGFGFVSVGAVTFETCAYVARYCTKKLTGSKRDNYEGREPEFCTCSRRPGIGCGYIDKITPDYLRTGSVPAGNSGGRMGIPRYYQSKIADALPETWKEFTEYKQNTNQILTERRLKDDEDAYRDYQKNLADFCKRHDLSLSKAEMMVDAPKLILPQQRRAEFNDIKMKQKMIRNFEK